MKNKFKELEQRFRELGIEGDDVFTLIASQMDIKMKYPSFIYYLFPILFLTSPPSLYAQSKQDTISFDEIKHDGRLWLFKGTPFTGFGVNKNKNDNILALAKYKNGLLEGDALAWYPNGQPKYIKPYKDGKADGLWTTWYPSGQLDTKSSYKEGLLHGVTARWDEAGNKFSEMHLVNGRKTGKELFWYPSGQIKLENNYSPKDGSRHGVQIHWFENGQKEFEIWRKENRRDSIARLWNEKGQKVMEEYYDEGIRLKRIVYENGKKQRELMDPSDKIKGKTQHLEIIEAHEVMWYEGPLDRFELRILIRFKQKVQLDYLVYGHNPEISGRINSQQHYGIDDPDNKLATVTPGTTIAIGKNFVGVDPSWLRLQLGNPKHPIPKQHYLLDDAEAELHYLVNGKREVIVFDVPREWQENLKNR